MRCFEDFTEGQVFELGEARITEQEILEFARRYDPQPFSARPAPSLLPCPLTSMVRLNSSPSCPTPPQ